jgi:hypothetical protein
MSMTIKAVLLASNGIAHWFVVVAAMLALSATTRSAMVALRDDDDARRASQSRTASEGAHLPVRPGRRGGDDVRPKAVRDDDNGHATEGLWL